MITENLDFIPEDLDSTFEFVQGCVPKRNVMLALLIWMKTRY